MMAIKPATVRSTGKAGLDDQLAEPDRSCVRILTKVATEFYSKPLSSCLKSLPTIHKEGRFQAPNAVIAGYLEFWPLLLPSNSATGCSSSTYCETTLMMTMIGMLSSMPQIPHSQVQNSSEINTAAAFI
jgi:hypothetical protein